MVTRSTHWQQQNPQLKSKVNDTLGSIQRADVHMWRQGRESLYFYARGPVTVRKGSRCKAASAGVGGTPRGAAVYPCQRRIPPSTHVRGRQCWWGDRLGHKGSSSVPRLCHGTESRLISRAHWASQARCTARWWSLSSSGRHARERTVQPPNRMCTFIPDTDFLGLEWDSIPIANRPSTSGPDLNPTL